MTTNAWIESLIGVPNLVDRIKGLGKENVRKQLYPIFKAIMDQKKKLVEFIF